MERQVAAVIELAAGRGERAVEILRGRHATPSCSCRRRSGLPAPIKPAPELLGEVLLELGRPAEAIDPFRQALERNANRTLSVLGLARAAAAAGSSDVARQRYRELLENYRRPMPTCRNLRRPGPPSHARDPAVLRRIRHRRHRRPHRARRAGLALDDAG